MYNRIELFWHCELDFCSRTGAEVVNLAYVVVSTSVRKQDAISILYSCVVTVVCTSTWEEEGISIC